LHQSLSVISVLFLLCLSMPAITGSAHFSYSTSQNLQSADSGLEKNSLSFSSTTKSARQMPLASLSPSYNDTNPYSGGGGKFPCTSNQIGDSESQPQCGDYYQSAYGYTNITPGNWDDRPSQISFTISFLGSTPSGNLASGQWFSEGVSTYSSTSGAGWDVGLNVYVGVNYQNTLSLNWYYVGTCEHPLYECVSNSITYTNDGSGSITASTVFGSSVSYTDTIDIWAYYCSTAACKSYYNSYCKLGGPQTILILDAQDESINSGWKTFADLCPDPLLSTNTAGNGYFFYGNSYNCVNGKDCATLGYQMGLASNKYPLGNWAVATLSNPKEGSNPVLHAETIGQEANNGSYPYWHENWWWGGSHSGYDLMSISALTSINALTSSQVPFYSFTPALNYYSNLQAFYALNEGTGNNANDSSYNTENPNNYKMTGSGNGFDGTLVNSPSWYYSSICPSGIVPYCLNFNSAYSQQVYLPSSTGLGTNGASQLTAVAWFWATTTTSNQKIFSVWSGDNKAAFDLALYGTHTYTELFIDSQPNAQDTYGTISSGKWYQLAITWSNVNNYYTVYLNGAYLGQVPAPFAGLTISSANANGSIGSLGNAYNYYFNGIIADPMVFTTELTSSQILQLYQGVLGQNYASTGTECISVTNFASLQSTADNGGQGSSLLGNWAWGHPFYDTNYYGSGGYYYDSSDAPCLPQSLTWTVAGGGTYVMSDLLQVW
jgi:hypothetical protein